jgi:hypothetical protein
LAEEGVYFALEVAVHHSRPREAHQTGVVLLILEVVGHHIDLVEVLGVAFVDSLEEVDGVVVGADSSALEGQMAGHHCT